VRRIRRFSFDAGITRIIGNVEQTGDENLAFVVFSRAVDIKQPTLATAINLRFGDSLPIAPIALSRSLDRLILLDGSPPSPWHCREQPAPQRFLPFM
jgi:hypothetical protein